MVAPFSPFPGPVHTPGVPFTHPHTFLVCGPSIPTPSPDATHTVPSAQVHSSGHSTRLSTSSMTTRILGTSHLQPINRVTLTHAPPCSTLRDRRAFYRVLLGSTGLGFSLEAGAPSRGPLWDRRSGGVSSHPVSPGDWSHPPFQSPTRKNASFPSGRPHTLRGQTYCRHGHLPPNQASQVQGRGAPSSSLGLAQGPSGAPAPRPATARDNQPVTERRAELTGWYPPMSHCPHATSWLPLTTKTT